MRTIFWPILNVTTIADASRATTWIEPASASKLHGTDFSFRSRTLNSASTARAPRRDIHNTGTGKKQSRQPRRIARITATEETAYLYQKIISDGYLIRSIENVGYISSDIITEKNYHNIKITFKHVHNTIMVRAPGRDRTKFILL